MSESLSLLERAARMAAIAHKGQVRKEGGTPYIVHPFMIALKLTKSGFPEPVIAAALVHDVPEDTDVTVETLRAELGDEVADIVCAVTNDDSLSWEEKKLKYIETVRVGSEGAKAVAIADKIHNAESLIAAHARLGPALWNHFKAGRDKKIWFEEKMLAMLKESWQHPLVEEYEALVRKMQDLV
ncbi:MAG: HD domain-containing protein [Rectinemataceae bacterium]|nr:HD domain-containing protein [Rectinemataceae bacterium]